MNYGVKKAIAGTRRSIRKAGQALADFDAQYANMADRRDSDYGSQIGHNQPLSRFFNDEPSTQLAKEHGRKGHGPLVYPEDAGTATKVLMEAGNAGLFVANVASRYALPAGGAVLAAKGITDVVTGQAFGGEADGQQPAQLRM